jgi:hypothetical protein
MPADAPPQSLFKMERGETSLLFPQANYQLSIINCQLNLVPLHLFIFNELLKETV